MGEVKTMMDAITTLQNAWNGTTKFSEQSRILDLADKAGSQMWMTCASPEDLKPYVEALTDRKLKSSFLNGLARVINAPNNDGSLIASNLRPYVAKEIQLASRLA